MATSFSCNRLPLSVPNPTAASADFWVYGSSRKRRILWFPKVSVSFNTHATISPSGQTFACDSCSWYGQPDCIHFRTISRTPRNNTSLGPGGPLHPWWLCTGQDVWESRDPRGPGRNLCASESVQERTSTHQLELDIPREVLGLSR